MIYKIAEFKVRKSRLGECLKAIKAFVQAVKTNEPNTLIYDSYQKPDKVSFIHFMCFKNSQAEAHHRTTPHVKKFVSVLYPNCAIKPIFTDLSRISE
ncbi:MAG: antibiotic biosynthesis monooxygenase [Candidatus Chisholmbacteria bacterium]|nr:antibiotic biosynthesis monooxygenase [Candidatus Chisholmbacteria bacterium]